MTHIKLFVILILSIALNSCSKDDPVQPPPHTTEPDTTTHEYMWETIFIGDAQSYLSDVFAINDSDVWTVGEIYLKDSTGKLDPKMYNAAHFDGKSWNVMRIKYYWQGDSAQAILQAVFGNSANDIWVGSTGPQRWDGGKWILYDVFGIHNGWINRMFGRNLNEFFMVGTEGASSCYDGTRFRKLETNTTIDLTDVFGNMYEVWAVGGNSLGLDGIVLSKVSSVWEKIDTLSTWSIHSVWCDKRGLKNNGFLAFAGDGIRYYDSTWKMPPKELTGGGLGMGNLYFNSIRGTERNNVFAVGQFGIVLHFTGKTWTMFPELFKYPTSVSYRAVSLTKNKVFLVGKSPNSQALISIGTKIQ